MPEEKKENENRVTLEVVPARPTALLRHVGALVRRGLDDLSKSLTKKGHVLVINDQDAVRALMEKILVADGYEVRSTCRQLDAIDIAKSFEPQVAMLGLTMPVTLGSELSALLSIPKIVLWGEPDDSEDLELRHEYYDFDLLTIPFDAERLLEHMRSWVAEAWTAKGVILDANGRHLEALQCHEKALTVEPLCVSAWLNKGYSLDELGRWPEAFESYDRAIEMNASDWTPWVRKGDLLDRAGQFEEAIRCFDSALNISAEILSGWMGRGTALHHLRRYKEALVCYDKVLEVDRPTGTDIGRAHVYSDAWNSKGTSFYRMGSYQESIECYEKAIEIDPEFAFPWYNKGNSLREMNSFEKAIRCYDRAIEVDSNHAGSWNNKGICLRKMGRLEEALMCYEKAVTSNPLEVLGWYNKALVQDELARVEDAINSYAKYVAVAPNDTAENVNHAQQRLLVLRAQRKT